MLDIGGGGGGGDVVVVSTMFNNVERIGGIPL